MAYWTQAEFEDFVSLNAVSDLPSDDLADIIVSLQTDADGEVNGYLETRFPTLPLPSPPDIIVLYSKKIAFYYLMLKYANATEEDEKTAREFYEDTILALGLINNGTITLVATGTAQTRVVSNAANIPKRHTLTEGEGKGTDNIFLYGPEESC